VSYYGAPQDDELGALGIGTPEQAARQVVKQARAYDRPGRPALPAFELIASLAHEAPGPEGLHRQRQTSAVIESYLQAIRRVKGLLILDIQPGQARFLDEVRALEPYLLQPDVSVALDSEWSVPSGVVPGEAFGSTDASVVNSVAAYLSGLLRRRNLPQKLLIVHAFTEGMLKGESRLVSRPGVATVLNADGFGTPELKLGVYNRLAAEREGIPLRRRPFSGVKLFFREDTGLMDSQGVLGLRPQPDVIVYE
jgi:hypothetical protein